MRKPIAETSLEKKTGSLGNRKDPSVTSSLIFGNETDLVVSDLMIYIPKQLNYLNQLCLHLYFQINLLIRGLKLLLLVARLCESLCLE